MGLNMPSNNEDDNLESGDSHGNNFAHGLNQRQSHQRVHKRLRHGTSDRPNFAVDLAAFREVRGEKKEPVVRKETPSQRNSRLQKQRERTANNRKKETPEEKSIRNEKERLRAKLRRNYHSMDVDERNQLESRLESLSTARNAGSWWPESEAHQKDRLKIESERQKESRLLILFVERANNFIIPRMAELEETLAALKHKKSGRTALVERCEGELFQLDWELSHFQKRFSLCLEPRRRPTFIYTKPKDDDNEERLVTLQKLICHEVCEQHRSLSVVLWHRHHARLQWNDSLGQMFPVPARVDPRNKDYYSVSIYRAMKRDTLIILDCGLLMFESEKSRFSWCLPRCLQEDDAFCWLHEFHLRCRKKEDGRRVANRKVAGQKPEDRRSVNFYDSQPYLKFNKFTKL